VCACVSTCAQHPAVLAYMRTATVTVSPAASHLHAAPPPPAQPQQPQQELLQNLHFAAVSDSVTSLDGGVAAHRSSNPGAKPPGAGALMLAPSVRSSPAALVPSCFVTGRRSTNLGGTHNETSLVKLKSHMMRCMPKTTSLGVA
jgi:hypothetical protein